MRTKKIEKKLADAVKAETPDVLDRILVRCTPETQPAAPIPIEAAKTKSRKWVKALYAAAAMLVLFVGGYFGISQYRTAYAAEYSVTLDASASVQFEVSKAAKVVSAAGLDAKGTAAIEAAQKSGKLKGQKLDTAVETVVCAMAENGGLEGGSSVLVTVKGPDEAENAKAKASVTEIVGKTLLKQGIKAAVLGQTAAADETLTALAKQYGISEGRAALIEKAAESDASLDKKELSKLDIGALNVLAQGGKTSVSVTVDSGASGYVSAEAAAKSACAKANVSLGGAASADVSADISDGTLIYKVKVKAGAGEVTCEVDAKTGAILNWVTSVVSSAVTGTAAPETSAAANAATPAPAPAPSESAGLPADVNIGTGTDQSVVGKVQEDLQTAVDKVHQHIHDKWIGAS